MYMYIYMLNKNSIKPYSKWFTEKNILAIKYYNYC